MVLVRKAVFDDVEDLTTFIFEQRTQDGRPITSRNAIQQNVSTNLKINLQTPEAHTVFVAVAEKNDTTNDSCQEQKPILGYAAAHLQPFLIFTAPEVFISELFVHPKCRGQGTGTKLLEAIISHAKEVGASRLCLINLRDRESYIRKFYEKHGFHERPEGANFLLQLQQ
eukprot:TRINITY_DN86843_c0_g1_i1.p1 TRINITY_DN86843_c0_g1~~TRINITY_DN86843_c0_g1_i1.p1  ORF type:complete len:169 (+),score=4.94 TRINITY_DN86843_c0_g1_i1:36-542(+)